MIICVIIFIGPIIQAEVGQVLLITFMNKASHPYSIQAHGVRTFSKPEAVMPGRGSWNLHYLPPYLTLEMYTKTPSRIHKAVCFKHYLILLCLPITQMTHNLLVVNANETLYCRKYDSVPVDRSSEIWPRRVWPKLHCICLPLSSGLC